MVSSVPDLRSLQSLRSDLIQHEPNGMPVADQLAQVKKTLLQQVGKAIVSGEFAATIGDAPQAVRSEWCDGTGFEHTSQRIRNPYLDVGVRRCGCLGSCDRCTT